jgi:hypothetical protein
MLAPPPAAPIPESLTSILAQARKIMAETGTVWAKAAAVRDLVRASLGDQNDCGVMATAFWSVGSIAGLPLRLVDSTANGQNPYDTHSTVEVWLAGLGRWAISDPTFNGYWTAGPEGAPLSAESMQSMLRAGENDLIYWHGAGTPNSLLPSRYYVDPTYLYAYTDYMAFVGELGDGFMVDSEADAFSVSQVFIPTSTTAMQSVAPNSQIPATVEQRTSGPSSAGAAEFTLPPRYAGALRYEAQLIVGAAGRVSLPFEDQEPAAIVTVETQIGEWQLEVGQGSVYRMDPYRGAWVSPMLFLGGSPVYLIAGKVAPVTVRVRIWATKDFPSDREVATEWDGS